MKLLILSASVALVVSLAAMAQGPEPPSSTRVPATFLP